MDESDRNLVAVGYDAVFDATPRSPTLRRLWREQALGGDFPEEFLHISFVTLRELSRIADELRLQPDSTLVDLGCGMAGPALWVTRHTNANLIGVDFSPVAVAHAKDRAKQLGLSSKAHFVVGSFRDTGLEGGCADAAMSEDAIQYAPDKGAAVTEAARILRPGGRFVFTAFELEPGHTVGLPVIGEDSVNDYRPLLTAAGFRVETYEEVPGWPEPMRTTYQALLDARDALMKEMGQVAAMALFSELTATLQHSIYRRRIMAVSTRL